MFSDHVSSGACCITALVHKLNPLRENIGEYVYSYWLLDITSKIRGNSSYESKWRRELKFTSAHT